MTQDTLTLYKLIILYLLNKVNFPMTQSQIGDFILEQEYTNFMTLTQAIAELSESNLTFANTVGNRTLLKITDEGQDTLTFFEDRLPRAIKNDIDSYLLENAFELRNEISILSNYYKSTSGEYEAHLIAKESDINLIDIKLSVPIESMAIAICENWSKKNEDIYKYITEQLF